MGAGCGKWREMSGIVCDKTMPIMLEEAAYKTVIRPALPYGIDTRAMGEAEQNFLERTEMGMFRWMLGIERIEKIGNEEIKARAGVADI